MRGQDFPESEANQIWEIASRSCLKVTVVALSSSHQHPGALAFFHSSFISPAGAPGLTMINFLSQKHNLVTSRRRFLCLCQSVLKSSVQTLSPDLTWRIIFRLSCKLAMQMHALRPVLIFSSVVVTSKDERLVTRLLIRHYVILWWGHQSSLYNLLPWGRNGMWQTKWKAMTFLSH